MKALFTRHKKWLLPVAVLVVAYGIATVIRNAGPEIEVVTPEPQPLVVRTVTAQPQQVRLNLSSQGQVSAEHMIDLVSELQGSITRVAPAFVTGGYFKAGDVLLQIDPIYAVSSSTYGLSQTKLRQDMLDNAIADSVE